MFLILPELWRFYFCLFGITMKQHDLKTALQKKSVELEAAMETGKPYKEILQIYKEIKDLQYKLLVAQLEEQTRES